MVPGAASTGLVVPIRLRTPEGVVRALDDHDQHRDRVMKATSSPKNGLPSCSA